MADQNVRRKLEAVANGPDISTQGVRLAALSVELGCSIHALSDYDPASKANFNCFEYVLRLTEHVRNALLATLADLDVLVDYRFVRRLGDAGLLHQKTLGEMKDGDLVLYWLDGKATHAGLWEGGRVRSKWGSGLIYEHDARGVPYSYGEPRWYRAIPPGIVKAQLVSFATDMGVSAEMLEDALRSSSHRATKDISTRQRHPSPVMVNEPERTDSERLSPTPLPRSKTSSRRVTVSRTASPYGAPTEAPFKAFRRLAGM